MSVERGRAAFERGADRVVPRDILVEEGIEAARAWYDGWDTANSTAKVAGWTDEENAAFGYHDPDRP